MKVGGFLAFLFFVVEGQIIKRHPGMNFDKLKESVVIKDDRQTHVQILKGQTKSILYLLQQDVEWLSITVTPCSYPIFWDVSFRPINDTGKVDMTRSAGNSVLSIEPRSFERQFAPRGLYIVRLHSPQGEENAQIFTTTLGSLEVLRPTTKLFISNKRQRGQISVRWPSSPIDSKKMVYYLVASPTRSFPSLCKATNEKNKLRSENSISYKNELSPYENDDIVIEYTERRTNAVLTSLKLNQTYFIELFAVNNDTHLSYLYANATFKYQRTRSLPLRDGRPTTANIKRMDGRVTFRYKVRAGETAKRIEWYVLTCGLEAYVDAEVRQRKKPVLPRTRVYGYSKLVLENPTPGSTYILRINSTNPDILDRINYVQVVGTMRGLKEPELPDIMYVYEDVISRGCKSVTLRWHAAKGTSLEYCAVVKEVTKSQEFLPFPDQCAQEKMFKNYEYTNNQCFSDIDPNLSLITEEIKYLRRGKMYDIQLTVRSGKSKILSYKNVRVKTKPSCHSN